MSELNDDMLYTIKEVSSILNFSENTLRNWDKSQKFVAIRTQGGHRRYLGKDIKKFIEKLQNERQQRIDDINAINA